MKPRIGITSTPAVYDERPVVRVNRWYVEAVARAGGLPLILPTLAPDDAAGVLAGLDGLVLTGGGDVGAWHYHQEVAPEAYDVDRARDAWELALVAAVAGQAVLGICRGAQLLNVAAGGSLIQHLPSVTDEQHWQRARDQEPVHRVEVEPASSLAQILGASRLGVNSIHHQAIAQVGEGFRAVAWATDGIVEAIERTDGAAVIAVQWHPESLINLPDRGQLFLWLTRTAAGHRPGLDLPESFAPAAPVPAGAGHSRETSAV